MNEWSLLILYDNDVWQCGVLYHDADGDLRYSEAEYRKLHNIASVEGYDISHFTIKFNSEETMLKFQMTYL